MLKHTLNTESHFIVRFLKVSYLDYTTSMASLSKLLKHLPIDMQRSGSIKRGLFHLKNVVYDTYSHYLLKH